MKIVHFMLILKYLEELHSIVLVIRLRCKIIADLKYASPFYWPCSICNRPQTASPVHELADILGWPRFHEMPSNPHHVGIL